jgi:enamine deaminase RidA (YjgF/YER057c/UK114 family)
MFARTAKGTRQGATVLMSKDPELLALQEQNGFADAVIAGNDVILSGVVTEMKDGDAGLEAAYTRTFEAIAQTLERAGASWDDVIEINSFHTDLASQIAPYVAVKKQFLQLPHPAWTAVGTTGLVGGSGITETRVRAKLAAPSD